MARQLRPASCTAPSPAWVIPALSVRESPAGRSPSARRLGFPDRTRARKRSILTGWPNFRPICRETSRTSEGLVMKRALVIVGLAAMASACFGGEKAIPAKTPLFTTNDCGPVSAVGREYYKFTSGDAAKRIKLNGEDAPWRPACDWKGLGFNVVEVSGPEGAAATPGMSEVS